MRSLADRVGSAELNRRSTYTAQLGFRPRDLAHTALATTAGLEPAPQLRRLVLDPVELCGRRAFKPPSAPLTTLVRNSAGAELALRPAVAQPQSTGERL